MGLPVTSPLDVFPKGFPEALIVKIEQFTKRKVIVNRPYSGTEVIKDYGEQQVKDGSIIVYTSGDSVLQVAANEKIIPVDELYRICRFIRRCVDLDGLRIGRIIARPFIGNKKVNFERTSNRKDFTLEPDTGTAIDLIEKEGLTTIGIGKINDIFSGRGIDKQFHIKSNEDGMNCVIKTATTDFTGFAFTNLVDFDAKYGHRRDVQGYGEALMRTDKQIGRLIKNIKRDDLLIITADHGNDPTFRGTDHTREFVPLIVYSEGLDGGYLGTRDTFSDLGATILDNFNIDNQLTGQSFLNRIK